MPARLSVYFPHRAVHRRVLEDGESCLIGRAGDCDLTLDDTRVSRRHARLEPIEGAQATEVRDRSSAGSWRLLDLGSKNGTFVDGRSAVPESPAIADSPRPSGPATDDEPTEIAAVALPESAWLSIGGLPVRFEILSEEQRLNEAELARERWQSSLTLQRRLDPSAGLTRLLDQLLDSVLEVTEAERAGVLLTGTDGSVSLAAAAGPAADELGAVSPGRAQAATSGDDRTFRGSRSAVEKALAEGRPVAVSDTWDDDGVGGQPSIVAGKIRSLVCLPLTVLDRTLGVVYADSTQPGSSFGELDVQILEALASHAALALGVARLHGELAGVRDEVPTRLGPAPASGPAGSGQGGPGGGRPATPAGLGLVWERALPTYRRRDD